MLGVQIAFDFSRGVAPNSGLTYPASERSSRSDNSTPKPASAGPSSAPWVRAQPAAADPRAVLEARLRAGSPLSMRLTITDNRRTMISLRRGRQFIEVRLHHMFLEADALTHDALSRYLFQSDASAAQQIGRFIDRHRERIRREAVQRPRRVRERGMHHDLAEVYRTINRRYFDDSVDARITWSRDPQPTRTRRSIKLGSYTARERLIRVHPALDAAFVPRFFVEYIVYHEMLHQVLPPKRQRGRRDLHGPAFKAREREFEHYAMALSWERDNLDRLLRRRHAGHGAGPRVRSPIGYA